METSMKKCHPCKGKGRVQPKLSEEQLKAGRIQEDVRIGDCYYCHGKGWRNTGYGQDKRHK